MRKVAILVLILVGVGLILSCKDAPDANKPPEEEEIVFVPPEETVTEPGTMTLVLFQQKKIEVTNPVFEGKTLVYFSNNKSVATVSKDGLVTGVGVPDGEPLDTSIPSGPGGVSTFDLAKGETTIWVKTSDNKYGAKVPVNVTMLGNEDILTLPSIYEQFEPYIPNFGSLLDGTIATDNVINRQLKKHFNIYTQQNQFKPQSMTVTNAPSAATVNNEPTFTLTNTSGDTWAGSAIAADKKIHYHVIVWHEQAQAWWWTALGTAKNDAGVDQSASGNITVWSPPRVDYNQAAKILKRWVDQSMNRTVSWGGTSGPVKQFVYSWDVINEAILSYPERLTVERTQHGTWTSPGTVNRNMQSVTGRGAWKPDATDSGIKLRKWSDPNFTWKDALRYGSSDEEYWDGKKQGNAFVRALGPDAIYLTYKYARMNDPNAILYINDYDTFRKNKADMIYKMVIDLNNKWKEDPDYIAGTMLINGMGAQEHNNIDQSILTVTTPDGSPITYNPIGTTVEGIEYNFSKWSSIPDMNLCVSEMDLRVYDNGGTGLVANGEPPSSGTPPTLQNQIDQAKLYGEMIKIYLKYSNNANGSHFDRITFWGHNDQNNWMSAGRPLWFDGSNTGTSNAKPAYYRVQQVLKEYAAANPR